MGLGLRKHNRNSHTKGRKRAKARPALVMPITPVRNKFPGLSEQIECNFRLAGSLPPEVYERRQRDIAALKASLK